MLHVVFSAYMYGVKDRIVGSVTRANGAIKEAAGKTSLVVSVNAHLRTLAVLRAFAISSKPWPTPNIAATEN